MSDEVKPTEQKTPEKPIEKPAGRRKEPLHPGFDLEKWVKDFNPEVVAERLAGELRARGINGEEDFVRPHAHTNVMAAVQFALALDAGKVRSLAKKVSE